MAKLRLAIFAMNQAAQFGLWKAGADMCGGSLRRQRADVHRNLSAKALYAMLEREDEGTA